MVMSGSDTKNISYYIVKYFSKAQEKSFNMSAMLVELQDRNKSYADGPTNLSAHDLLVKFVNMANSRQEIGAPLAIATLMGWAPKIASHRPRKIFLGDVHRTLKTHVLKGLHPHRYVEIPSFFFATFAEQTVLSDPFLQIRTPSPTQTATIIHPTI